ncbi:hypothetical protein EV207_1154 [Scopulibacillus darangshiensis]|uniref:Uncharacterized protein n=1 Tax=Scopulibacillus darangshiensis TaxID=442528 RepID=A0A4R2P235_9BACL|nr:hypothetical protein [Scopulibacillus darangshiensis]TCP28779.1 hypothetical protein EV207_1154 [Scopulibacillus darangshiensis]
MRNMSTSKLLDSLRLQKKALEQLIEYAETEEDKGAYMLALKRTEIALEQYE